MPVCWQGFLPWPADTFWVLQGFALHCLLSSSDESEDDEEETGFFFVFLELALVPDSAAGVLPALAEDRGRCSSSSESAEEEEQENEEGGGVLAVDNSGGLVTVLVYDYGHACVR